VAATVAGIITAPTATKATIIVIMETRVGIKIQTTTTTTTTTIATHGATRIITIIEIIMAIIVLINIITSISMSFFYIF